MMYLVEKNHKLCSEISVVHVKKNIIQTLTWFISSIRSGTDPLDNYKKKK